MYYLFRRAICSETPSDSMKLVGQLIVFIFKSFSFDSVKSETYGILNLDKKNVSLRH